MPTNTSVGHTFDPPAIPAQECYYKFVTLDNADRGEMVIMSESGANQLSAGLMLMPTMARDGGVPLAAVQLQHLQRRRRLRRHGHHHAGRPMTGPSARQRRCGSRRCVQN